MTDDDFATRLEEALAALALWEEPATFVAVLEEAADD